MYFLFRPWSCLYDLWTQRKEGGSANHLQLFPARCRCDECLLILGVHVAMGDKAVFVVSLAMVKASMLSPLRVWGSTQLQWGKPKNEGISFGIWLICRTFLPSFPLSYIYIVHRPGGLQGLCWTCWFIHCYIITLIKGPSLSNGSSSLHLRKYTKGNWKRQCIAQPFLVHTTISCSK